MIEPTKQQIATLQQVMGDVQVQGTEVRYYEAGYGSYNKYDAPWYVVDTGTAEYDVNYPGDLISTHADREITKRLMAVL
jgi:hypothetical protein